MPLTDATDLDIYIWNCATPDECTRIPRVLSWSACGCHHFTNTAVPLDPSNNQVQMHRGHFEMLKSSFKFPHWLYLPLEFIRILKIFFFIFFFHDCSSVSVLSVLPILARVTKKIPGRTIRCPMALWTASVFTWCSVGFSAAHSYQAFKIRHHNPGKSNTFSLCGVVVA